jgi:hypothetical protein
MVLSRLLHQVTSTAAVHLGRNLVQDSAAAAHQQVLLKHSRSQQQ